MTNSQDYTDLLELFSKYIFAMDLGDPDAVAECFTEDAIWGGGVHGAQRGREAIRTMMQKRKERLDERYPGKAPYEYRRHYVTNHELTVSPDGNSGEFRAYLLGTMRSGEDFSQIEAADTGYYQGVVVRDGGGDGWRFQERYSILDSEGSSFWPTPVG